MANYDLTLLPSNGIFFYAMDIYHGEGHFKLTEYNFEENDNILIAFNGQLRLLRVTRAHQYPGNSYWLDFNVVWIQFIKDMSFDKAVDKVMQKYDWEWNKHMPKRDLETWNLMAEDFISLYKDVMSNYSEEDGVPGSRNSEELMELFELCVKHPDLRFFQALIFMIKRDLYVMDKNPDSSPGLELPGRYHSTFAWERDSYERSS